jgi:hypothetical protein
MSDDWTDAELQASVDAYNLMARREAERKSYSKRQVYRDLAAAYPRTEKAFEFRMQNISAVLDEMGEPWVPGLKPAVNVGANVKPRLAAMLAKTTKRRSATPKVEPIYKDQLPAIRDWLIEIARAGATVRYGEVMASFGIGFRNIRRVMDWLGHQSENLDEPIITALIVDPKGKCSPGFEKEFGVHDDAAERVRLYEYWKQTPNAVATPTQDQQIEVRAARFVAVEVRPDQAAFRRAVFMAHKGECAISGCDVVKALDAAHCIGRDWRAGHNRAEDGFLLRKDLHALYDNGLLKINDAGVVWIDPAIHAHYGELDGKTMRAPVTQPAVS